MHAQPLRLSGTGRVCGGAVISRAAREVEPMVTERRRRNRRAERVAVEPPPGRAALTIQEAAWLLSCAPSTVDNLRRSGKLASVKVGRAVRISRQTIDEYLAAGGSSEPSWQPVGK
jgi:excisionase family DNA binding protein